MGWSWTVGKGILIFFKLTGVLQLDHRMHYSDISFIQMIRNYRMAWQFSMDLCFLLRKSSDIARSCFWSGCLQQQQKTRS